MGDATTDRLRFSTNKEEYDDAVDGVYDESWEYYENPGCVWGEQRVKTVEIYCHIDGMGEHDVTYLDRKKAEKNFKSDEDEWRYSSRGVGDSEENPKKLVKIVLTRRLLKDLLKRIDAKVCKS